jgi:hypothetical protein
LLACLLLATFSKILLILGTLFSLSLFEFILEMWPN